MYACACVYVCARACVHTCVRVGVLCVFTHMCVHVCTHVEGGYSLADMGLCCGQRLVPGCPPHSLSPFIVSKTGSLTEPEADQDDSPVLAFLGLGLEACAATSRFYMSSGGVRLRSPESHSKRFIH